MEKLQNVQLLGHAPKALLEMSSRINWIPALPAPFASLDSVCVARRTAECG